MVIYVGLEPELKLRFYIKYLGYYNQLYDYFKKLQQNYKHLFNFYLNRDMCEYIAVSELFREQKI